ncbi:PREDICTED: very-long-chain (3R)-3-hydroxyacyl-CoA dehydratase [Drosophila arizonae]|uniref:Very-long-chain (3R)-3-hydroxyacyl-CoA dehydratase n=1 Tax=Drosophila arizonae TaxID=7263 RepID=A0ABM1NRR7_DROAR|nr:PREDICTED: very-long-chain (3R)-3-hydroxyacyl-CoA dehydratase [Drosophila arizonae]XP_017857654.1 PREDICTED: very-long-chain (3R)-3-hydroxyacyl-CoA dehydratase [Drosophila arizonae]
MSPMSNANSMAPTELSPFVYWSQTKGQLLLKVDLKDAQGVVAEFTSTTLSFAANGHGARGRNAYKFQMRFFLPIDDETATFSVTDHKIELQIRKAEPAWWQRLIATPQKPHWLRIDFDRWRTEDDGDLSEGTRDVREDYVEEYNKLQKQEIGYVKEHAKKVYLIIYNLAMFVGYLHILLIMGVLYIRDGSESMKHTYEYVGTSFKFVQLMQYLEVMHPLFGYTKGSPLMPFFQISGRNFVLFLMIEMEPRMHAKPVVFYVFVIWSLVEIVRYPYYVSQLVKRDNGLLTWLRYTIWIPLYPMGLVCEGVILLRSIPYIEETKRFCVDMPNKWNWTFDMVLFLKVYLLLLALPGTFMVMSHMSKLRAKKLGRGRAKPKVN